MFGFLEFEDDPEVAARCCAAAAAWLRERGRDRMVGPMDFTMNDESGVLIEGFEREADDPQPWHPPVLPRAAARSAGLEKAMDLLMWELQITDRDADPARSSSSSPTSVRAQARDPAAARCPAGTLRRDMDVFAEVYNAAWATQLGLRALRQGRPRRLRAGAAARLRPRLVHGRRETPTGETVGVAITVPDINQVLKKMNGRMLPFGWWHFLRRRRIDRPLRVGFLGVKPEYQHTGVAAQLYVEHFDMAEQTPGQVGRDGLDPRDQHAMNRGMEAMGGRIVKRYRMYERRLEPDAAARLPADAKVWTPTREIEHPAS